MKGVDKWLALGWRHPMWDVHRFYLSLAKKKRFQQEWLEELRVDKKIALPDGSELPIDQKTVNLFFDYSNDRDRLFEEALTLLRTEEEALDYCAKNQVSVLKTATKSQDHHQSSKAMIAAVTHTASQVCDSKGVTVDPDPQARCVWCNDHGLHVSARNLDGAVPGLANPSIVWEIKEYWGKTGGGSKMSDAVYECHLVGLELREFESRGGNKVTHVVFIDGKHQWATRKSDLRRLIDLMNQGLIDHLIIGREVEHIWKSILESNL